METRLYSPVKRFLEGFGLEVKGEVCGCDLVALDRGTPAALVIGELKLSFTLELVLQAVDRSVACDEVWLAVRARRDGVAVNPTLEPGGFAGCLASDCSPYLIPGMWRFL